MQLRKRSNRHCAESVRGRLVPSCVCGLGAQEKCTRLLCAWSENWRLKSADGAPGPTQLNGSLLNLVVAGRDPPDHQYSGQYTDGTEHVQGRRCTTRQVFDPPYHEGGDNSAQLAQ